MDFFYWSSNHVYIVNTFLSHVYTVNTLVWTLKYIDFIPWSYVGVYLEEIFPSSHMQTNIQGFILMLEELLTYNIS